MMMQKAASCNKEEAVAMVMASELCVAKAFGFIGALRHRLESYQ